MNCTFEELQRFISMWNMLTGNQKGAESMDVLQLVAITEVFEKAIWKNIVGGLMKGGRCFECSHGIVVQESSNLMTLFPANSLIAKEVLNNLG
jgi:hypothetical protein